MHFDAPRKKWQCREHPEHCEVLDHLDIAPPKPPPPRLYKDVVHDARACTPRPFADTERKVYLLDSKRTVAEREHFEFFEKREAKERGEDADVGGPSGHAEQPELNPTPLGARLDLGGWSLGKTACFINLGNESDGRVTVIDLSGNRLE